MSVIQVYPEMSRVQLDKLEACVWAFVSWSDSLTDNPAKSLFAWLVRA
jgi:hypothetical protein